MKSLLLLFALSLAQAFADGVEPYYLESRDFPTAKLGEGAISAAVLGDSLSQDFYTSGTAEALGQMTTKRLGNWFAAKDMTDVKSLFQHLAAKVPTRPANFARVAAYIPANNKTDGTKKFIGGVLDLDDQVALVLKEKQFPNLILSWIGHNNLDWKYDLSQNPKLNAETHRAAIPKMVAQAYLKQVDLLLEKAKKQPYPVAIIVYGLGNLKSFFEARRLVKNEKDKDPKLFPNFEMFYERFTSFTPTNEEVTTELWGKVNQAVSEMVEGRRLKLKDESKRVFLLYSDIFEKIAIDSPKLLHPKDGFHLSAAGHSKFAKASSDGLKEVLLLLKN